jgi:TolA-binding protein
MFNLVSRLVVAAVAASSVGCATYAAENRRLLDDLSRSRDAAVENQVRLVEVEQRLRQIELEAQLAAERSRANELGVVAEKLDLLIAQNQQILLQASAPLPPEVAAIESAAVADACTDASDPKERLRYWAERLRNDPSVWRGGLSPAQNQALNILLRRERLLDPLNPWQNL